MTPSQESLKAYVITKIGAGTFAGMRSPTVIAAKIAAELAVDLPVVLKDLANNMAESGIRNLGVMALDKAEALARDVAKRGVKAILADLQAQYARGEEARRRGR